MTEHRTRTALAMGLREYRRMPLLLALLVALPAYLLGVFSQLLPSTGVVLDVPGEGQQTVDVIEVYIAMFTPLVAGLVAGIAGLFLMRATAAPDSRLVIAGYRAREVVTARFGLLAAVTVLVSTVAVGITLGLVFRPANLPIFVGATLLGGLSYGLVGVLAGHLFDRLGGVYLILFGTMIDMFLFQNPLADDQSSWAVVLPGYAPVRGAIDAAFSASPDPGTLVLGTGYVLLLGVVATLAFYRSTKPA